MNQLGNTPTATPPLWRSPVLIGALLLALAIVFHAWTDRWVTIGDDQVFNRWTGEVCQPAVGVCFKDHEVTRRPPEK